MGQLIDGVWSDQDQRRQGADGAFVRPESPWRRRVTADGSSGFPAEDGRYHLYVNLGCPWAWRTVSVTRSGSRPIHLICSTTNRSISPAGIDRDGHEFQPRFWAAVQT